MSETTETSANTPCGNAIVIKGMVIVVLTSITGGPSFINVSVSTISIITIREEVSP
jgi:hypothetical protein